MPILETTLQRHLFYFFIIVGVFLLCSCRRNMGIQTIVLDKTTQNSYFQHVQQELNENETIINHNGQSKVSVIAADLEWEELRFRISLVDVNQDGIFNTPQVDMLVLSPYGQDKVAMDLDRTSVGHLRMKNFIQVNRSWFRLLEIDSLGHKLSLVQLEKPLKEPLVAQYSTRWKPINVLDLEGQPAYLKPTKDLSKKELILIARSPSLEDGLLQFLIKNKADWQASYDLSVLYLGAYEKNKAEAVMNIKDFQFPAFFATHSSCVIIDCHASPPYGIVLDRDGTILKEGIKKEEIMSVLGLI